WHANGAVSHVRADWLKPGTPFRSRIEVVGSDGALGFDTASPDVDGEGYAPTAEPYRAQLADFIDGLRTGREARVTAADGVAAVELLDAAYAALASGRPVLLGRGPLSARRLTGRTSTRRWSRTQTAPVARCSAREAKR